MSYPSQYIYLVPPGYPPPPGIPIQSPLNPLTSTSIPYPEVPSISGFIPAQPTQPQIGSSQLPRQLHWTTVTSPNHCFTLIVHPGCDTCQEFTRHLDLSHSIIPIPSEVILRHVSNCMETYTDEFKALAAIPSETSHTSIFDRLGIRPPPSHTQAQSDPSQLSPDDHIQLIDLIIDSEFTKIIKAFLKDAYQPLPPYIYHTSTTPHWVPNPHELGLHPMPSPIFRLSSSPFLTTLYDFFRAGEGVYKTCSETELLRFRRAACNTHPDCRTDLMKLAARDHYRHLRKLDDKPDAPDPSDVLTMPYGLPEQCWELVDLWRVNPSGIPATIRIQDNHLNPWDFYVFHWITMVTWSRNFQLLNLMLILFMGRGAALQYIWNTYLEPTGIPCSVPHFTLPWQFSVNPHIGFRITDYTNISHSILTRYLLFLIQEGHLPLDQPSVLSLLCDWADYIWCNQRAPGNTFGDKPSLSPRRMQTIHAAQQNQPWMDLASDHARSYPMLKLTPIYGNWHEDPYA